MQIRRNWPIPQFSLTFWKAGYHNKDKKLLAKDYGLIYPVTPINIKEKMF